MVKRKTIYETKSDRIFTFINYVFLTVLLVVFAYPMIYIVSASFSSGTAIITNKVWLFPVDFNLEGYKAVFNYRLILSAYRNSFFYMITGTFINLVMTVLAAYPLSRKDFYGGKAIALIFVFTMFFNSGLIPTYILVRNLGMRNTIWAMIIPNAMSVWNVIVTRTYFQSNLSGELLEATQIDGCTDFKFVWKIALPLSAPIIAVMVLF
jgi:multiple sugar transport system permease protein/putative aldouronate transport system permease protein